jgi:hypothetical protein
MATIKDFLTRIKNIEGVAGCLLTKRDGSLLGHIINDHDKLPPLLVICSNYAQDIMVKTGFAHCQSISFNRQSGQNFHIFLFQQYYLGVIQTPDCPLKEMLAKINNLLSLVKSDAKGSNVHGSADGRNQAGL